MKTNSIQKNIPNGWKLKKLSDLLYYERPDAYIVKSTSYSDKAKTPVLTANKSFILGYTDEDFGIYKNIPAVIFDDFTTDSKFVDFPFKIKSSAIKILKEKGEEVDLRFIFEKMKSVNFPTGSHKRFYISQYQNLNVALPPIKEQQKIAEILGTVDEDIAKTQEVIEATEKIKRGLMQQLFTRGIGHTKFKETKIGQIPEGWGISLMADKIDFQEGPGILAKDFYESGVPLIRLEGINSDSLLKGCNYLDQDLVAKKWSHFRLQKGDILLSSSASLGRVTIVGDEGVGAIVYTGIIRFRPKDSSVSNSFIQCFLTSPVFQEQIGSHDTGSTIKHFGPSHLKKMWFVVPSIKEQKEITEILSAVDEKISVNKKLKEKLTFLKKGLMQDLLSGSKRTKV
jgi:type I restriction enzyme S subunit